MKTNKGITMIALTITIVVLLIIASIAVFSGKDTIKRAYLEELRTNMLLIQAKARECVEKVNFKLGPNQKEMSEIATIRQEVYGTEGLKKASEVTDISIPSEIPVGDTVYVVTTETLNKWGLGKISLEKGENYLIEFDEKEASVEIYNTLGYDGKYDLTQIDKL